MRSTEEIIDSIDEALERPVIGCPTIQSPNQQVLEDYNNPMPFSQGTIFGEWLGTVPPGFNPESIVLHNGFRFTTMHILYSDCRNPQEGEVDEE